MSDQPVDNDEVKELRAQLAEAQAALQASLPEAGAVIYFDMKSQGGVPMKVTLRAQTGPMCVDEVARTIKHAMVAHKWSVVTPTSYSSDPGHHTNPQTAPTLGPGSPPPPPPAQAAQPAGAPPPPPAAPVEQEIGYEVDTITHITFHNKGSGKDSPALQVKLRNPPPSLSRFGTVLAFGTTIPEPIKSTFGSWPLNQPFATDAKMRTVYLIGTKVSRFA